ncbi:hypothetical protein LINPERHAP1_LOCUS32247 [Linum perenne]
MFLESVRPVVGGLARTREDCCLTVFTESLDKCSIIRVELSDVVSGLRLVWDLGFFSSSSPTQLMMRGTTSQWCRFRVPPSFLDFFSRAR